MLKKSLSILVCLLLLLSALPVGEIVLASGVEQGDGSLQNPYIITSVSEMRDSLLEAGSRDVYLRLGDDIIWEGMGCFGPESVYGKKHLDLAGHLIKSKLPYFAQKGSFSLFIIESGASLTLDDSVGGGEVIYDRYIPPMGEMTYESDVLLSRPVTVFEVKGSLTVNGGEITAGHYESEYYTFTDGIYYLDSSPSPGTVNSITPGNAVVVKSGGRFVSNGGEYYGRGFVMDDEGYKESSCAALQVELNGTATVYAGDFYGKSNADVCSINPRANFTVFSGNFYARYDNRITTDKLNGVAYYTNVDCGRIGVPLYAFQNGKEAYTHVYLNSAAYNMPSRITESENNEFLNLGTTGTGYTVTVTTLGGNGTAASPYEVTIASDLQKLLQQTGLSKVYLRLENDITDCKSEQTVTGNVVLDLNGHLLKKKLGFNDWLSSYSLFIISSGSSMTLDDSAGGGEIIFDRVIPAMGDITPESDIILYRTLTVFEVRGNLTVNAGEITAGHYESEYYTYIKKYNTGGDTSAGTVNSITPGNAVRVKDGGRFVSNGGEYYGRGFTINENGEKDFVCAALYLDNGAIGIINDGDFHGKSNADALNVGWGANAHIYSGTFASHYDNRITVDKRNGIAYYVNVDCGKIGIPLRSFSHSMSSRLNIKVNSETYTFNPSFTTVQDNAFVNLGASGTGATVEVTTTTSVSSQLTTQDNSTAAFAYSPGDHYEIMAKDGPFFNESFGKITNTIHTASYSWLVQVRVGSRWGEVEYKDDAPVSGNLLITSSNRLDLYDLSEYMEGGLSSGSQYRVQVSGTETWNSNRTYTITTTCSNTLSFSCNYEPITSISLPDDQTGIEWPVHGNYPQNYEVETPKSTASLYFQEKSQDTGNWAVMLLNGSSAPFSADGTYRLKIYINAKALYTFDENVTVTVGGRTATVTDVDSTSVTANLPVDVQPATVRSVVVEGTLTNGTKLSSTTPLTTKTAHVSISTTWFRNGSTVSSGSTATFGNYYARIRIDADRNYVLAENAVIKVFGKPYSFKTLSSDRSYGIVETDMQTLTCTHAGNTNTMSYNDEEHYLICSVCGAEISRGTHTMGSWTSQGPVDVRKCSGCAYEESVSNGKIYVPHIRLTGDIPMVGDQVPTLAICDEDAAYATLEGVVEWFEDGIDYTHAVAQNTVMKAGSVYYAQVKMHPNSGYYFDNHTVITTKNTQASGVERSYTGYTHGEVILKFTPRTDSAVEVTLGETTVGKTYETFLSEFEMAIDGSNSEFAMTLYKNNVQESVVVYNRSTGAWWISSGSVEEFLGRVIEKKTEYKVILTAADSQKYFDPEKISVVNSAVADSVTTTGGDKIFTLTAIFDTSSHVIETVALTGIAYPIDGDLIPAGLPEQSGHYRITDLYWIDSDLNILSPGDAFVLGKTYMVIARVTAEGNYIFAEDSELTATVDGEESQIIAATDKTISVRCKFPPVTKRGDFDGDGELNASDMVQMRTLLISEENHSPKADMNQDGEIDIRDMVRMKKMIAETA